MSCVHVLSVGLNVGDREPGSQLGASLRAVEALFGPPLSVAMGRSEWEGVPERFVQVAVLTDHEAVLRRAPLLAAALHRQTIAVIRPGASRWTLTGAGGPTPGGTVAEFPVLADVPAE